MATRSRADLRTRARIRADQTDSGFPTDTEYNLLLDDAAHEVWFDLHQAGWPFIAEDYSVALDGTGSYLLGTPRTMASFTIFGHEFWWVDDGTDPADKNDWEIWYDNHLGAPRVDITVDTGTRIVTLDWSTNASPSTKMSHLQEALEDSGYFTTEGTWSASAVISIPGVSSVAEGVFAGGTAGDTPVMSVRGVFKSDGTEVPRLREENRGGYIASAGSSVLGAYEVASATDGARLRTYPTGATGTITANVVREWPGFTSDAEPRWYGPARSDELVVLRAAAKALRKEGDDQAAAQLDREFVMLFDRIQNMANWLDMRNPATIRDVHGGLRAPRDPFDYDVD